MNPVPSIAPYIGPLTIGIVVTAAAIDLQQRRIPNWLTFGAWLLALPLQLLLHGLGAGMQTWLYGWLCGLALFYPFTCCAAWPRATSLMAAVGALLGAAPAPHVALATFLAGGAWALALVVRQGAWPEQAACNLLRLLPIVGRLAPAANHAGQGPVAPRSVGSLPYGVAIAAGTLYVLFTSA